MNSLKTRLKIYLLFMLIFTAGHSKAQYEWFPVGAKWYYNHPNYTSLSGDGSKYLLFTVSKDTTIKNRACKKITISENGNNIIASEYLHQEGDSIFYYNYYSEEFYLLYDFSAKAGDTIMVHHRKFKPTKGFFANPSNDSINQFQYLIEQVDSVKISNIWIKRQQVSSLSNDDWGFYKLAPSSDNNYIVETIGSIDYFFGKSSNTHPEMQPALLRCYESDIINYSNELWENACDYYTSILDIDKSNRNNIYPNPTNGILNLQLNEPIETVDIFDLKGRLMYSNSCIGKTKTIDVTHLNAGIYIVKLGVNSNYYNYKIKLN